MTKKKAASAYKRIAPLLNDIESEDKFQIDVIGLVAEAIRTGAQIGRKEAESRKGDEQDDKG